ncbi:MAG TPA: M14 family metallopeptidase [Gemmatimonadales bacterium]|nr:M14 family metallopeptidase [Gemmatimonadales bacterium]
MKSRQVGKWASGKAAILRPLMFAAVIAAASAAPVAAQAGALAALGSPPNPKVPTSWDRYYDHAGIAELGRRLQTAYPDRCRFSSIGKSYEGREIWLLTVTNFKHGDPDQKPAMYIDGNIHSNEIQGTEIALYTAWYLCEMADRVPYVDSLLNDRVFYIVPTINPDGREDFLHEPNTPHSPRSGVAPRDNDGDGLVDEDGFDDLNGDGFITMMRRRNPNGRWIVSPEDPRLMIQAAPDKPGEYELLGYEGYDNDGDGEVNEDGIGYYDPNRNWPWRWQPQYIQGGADYYPTSLPETRAVMAFIEAHPNIAGAQSYHNNGGMILRGPGVPQDNYRPQDIRAFDQIGRVGEQILPGYKYMVVWKDLYTVWGGELDWLYGARGIITFSNEVWTAFEYFDKDPADERYDDPDYKFDRLLLLGEAVVPWTPVQHPQYGAIEVGGVKKQYTRAVPGFLLPREAHRNMAFTIYQAGQMPLVRVDSIVVRRRDGGLSEVTAIVANKRLAPTHTQQDIENQITRPDYVSLSGGEVVAGFLVDDPRQNLAREQRLHPGRLDVSNIPGMGTVTVRWLVRGDGPFTVTVSSAKGGTRSTTTASTQRR